MVRTRLVCLENTHNRGGGRVYPLEKIQAISALGAAARPASCTSTAPACGTPSSPPASRPATWARQFDTVSVCFSKGLGAPVGSALAGPRDFIARARRVRKLFGGGMRQAGVIAAAALYALDHHVDRLAEDHRNAQVIAEAIADTPGLRLDPPEVETNLIWFEVEPDARHGPRGRRRPAGSAACWSTPPAPQTLRACTHLDVSAAQAERAADAIRRLSAVPGGAVNAPSGEPRWWPALSAIRLGRPTPWF